MLNLKRCVKTRTVIGRLAVIAIVVTFLASIGIVWLGGANQDSAGIPHQLSYQGVLADHLGDPVPDGTYQMTFSIYENATGGSALWSETRTVQVTDGRFSILLGSVTPIPSDVFMNGSERWLGVQVESDAEMTPRQRLASVAYAYVAEYTRNPLAPGQGLVITDADGNVTHRLNANGTSWHAGLETFDGGINVTGPHQSPHWTCTITDKGSYYRDENGVLREEVLADGTHRQWDENGILRREEFLSGTHRQWDENGTLRYEHYPYQVYPGMKTSTMRWDENGTLRYTYAIETDGAIYTGKRDKKGILRYEERNTGEAETSYKKYYDEDGDLYCEMRGDGSEKRYYKNGQLEYEKKADTGNEIWYDSDGNIVCEKLTPKDLRYFNEDNLNKVYERDSAGNTKQAGTSEWQVEGSNKKVEIGPDGLSTYNTAGDLTAEVSSEIGCAWFNGKGEFSDDVEIDGELTVHGPKGAVVSTQSYGNRTTYCDESAEIYFFDRGEAHLDGGTVTIELDPIFLETVTIDDTHPMLVQLTPTAECNGLYVAQRTTSNFTVQELQGGSSDAGFMWEVAAKRTGYEDTRLAEAD